MPCLLVALLVSVAVHLALSHMYYDIVQGFISGCLAALVQKVLGGSRLVC
jgi:fructose-specific phosphotransferase system IIC component